MTKKYKKTVDNMDAKLYYRFEPIGIDVSDEEEVKRYNEELTSFAVLERQFDLLKTAYNEQLKERADVIINALPVIDGVAELAVFHNIKFKLFSRTVKWQKFSLCVDWCDELGNWCLYFYDTQDFDEVVRIFDDFVTKRKIPDFSFWEKTKIS